MATEEEDLALDAFLSWAETTDQPSRQDRVYSIAEAEELLEPDEEAFWQSPPVLSRAQIDALYEIGRDLGSACREAGVTFWMDGGTLLGAIRHGGLIPWDDDLDFAILKADASRFRRDVQPKLRARGYKVPRLLSKAEEQACELKVLDWWFGGFRVCRGDAGLATLDGSECTYPFADVFLMKESGDGGLGYIKSRAAAIWPSGLSRSDVVETMDLDFGPLRLPAPASAAAHLESLYGADWASVGYQIYNHATGCWTRKLRVAIPKFTPVLPSPEFDEKVHSALHHNVSIS